MNKESIEMINAMAEKLGTTAEYLWEVLIRQAPISGSLDLIGALLMTSFCVFWGLLVRKKVELTWEWQQEGEFFGWLSVFVIILISIIFVPFALSGATTAFINPEYWALKQIIK